MHNFWPNSLICRSGSKDEPIHDQLNLVQQLDRELSCKNMIIPKNCIHISKVVGSGIQLIM